MLSDAEIQRITEAVRAKLSTAVDADQLEQAVRAVVDRDTEPAPPVAPSRPGKARASTDVHPEFEEKNPETGRTIVAAFGRNRPGVAAALTAVLADCGCDIFDITQKILQEFFSMIMIVELTDAGVDFATLRTRLAEVEARLGITVLVQHEDVFRAMHRI